VVNDRIRFGLAAVKNVGSAAIDSILEVRDQSGRYTSLDDFCARVDARKVNRRVIESLIKAGAFDSLGARRSQLFAILDQAMSRAQSSQRDKQSGQISLFAALPKMTESVTSIDLPDLPEWDEKEKLAYEKETVGFYITGHPLDNYRRELKEVVDTDLGGLATWPEGQPVRVGGLVRTIKEHKNKKGERMAFLTMEDTTGAVEVIVFADLFRDHAALLASTAPIIIQGRYEKNEAGGKIIAETLDPIEEARRKFTARIHVVLSTEQINRPVLDGLKQAARRHYGTCPLLVTLHFADRGEVDMVPGNDLTVLPGPAFTSEMEKLLGAGALRVERKQTELSNQKGRNGWGKKG
jgi:DNA polymerase-3 subunit alpha